MDFNILKDNIYYGTNSTPFIDVEVDKKGNLQKLGLLKSFFMQFDWSRKIIYKFYPGTKLEIVSKKILKITTELLKNPTKISRTDGFKLQNNINSLVSSKITPDVESKKAYEKIRPKFRRQGEIMRQLMINCSQKMKVLPSLEVVDFAKVDKVNSK